MIIPALFVCCSFYISTYEQQKAAQETCAIFTDILFVFVRFDLLVVLFCICVILSYFLNSIKLFSMFKFKRKVFWVHIKMFTGNFSVQ